MRISDWSSDVCSSDLAVDLDRIELVEPLALEQRQRRNVVEGIAEIGEQELPPVVLRQRGEAFGEQPVALAIDRGQVEIGRATGRERVCQEVYISVVGVHIKKKDKKQNTTN